MDPDPAVRRAACACVIAVVNQADSHPSLTAFASHIVDTFLTVCQHDPAAEVVVGAMELWTAAMDMSELVYELEEVMERFVGGCGGGGGAAGSGPTGTTKAPPPPPVGPLLPARGGPPATGSSTFTRSVLGPCAG